MFASKSIGIDLGTANTLIYMKGKGIIMREPSVVAVDVRTDVVKYVGQAAKDVIGRTPGSIEAIRPLKDGVIADFDVTASMLQWFFQKSIGRSRFGKPRVVICIPSGVTAVERRAVREAAEKAGAKYEMHLNTCALWRSPWRQPSGRASRWRRPSAAWWWTSAAAPPRWR